MKKVILLAFALSIFYSASSQKIAFMVSDVIRDNYLEAKQAEQRIKSIVEEWKREIDIMDKKIEDLKMDINRNRLIWTDEEKLNKDKELSDQLTQRLEFSRRKFEPGGDYDNTVKMIMKPVEEKIYAAVQQVAGDEGFDFIIDKSVTNLSYANSKYDMTVKILRKLGVDVDKLEKELLEKIEKDPRNQKKETKDAPGKRTKSRKSKTDREVQREEQNDQDNKNPDQNPEPDKEPESNPANPIDTTKIVPFK